MRLTEIAFEGQRPIDGYGPGGFRIGGEWVEGSQIVTPVGRVALGPTLDAPALEPVVEAADAIDVVLIGQGAEVAFLDPGLRALLEEAGLGVEAMSTPSACRAYNVLLAEARRVAAVLIAL